MTVRASQKIFLEPEEETFIDVNTIFLSDRDYLFENTENNANILCIDSVINSSASKILDNDNNCNKGQFQIYVKNLTKESIHINKGTKMGTLTEIDEIIPQETEIDNNNKIVTDSTTQILNYIQASDEILNLRRKELSPLDFDVKHLQGDQEKKLKNILLTNFAAFSKSMKTLGHTDKVIPNLKFITEFPIKTLPFPIPQSLQQEAKSQINQLVEAGIIERNCSEWACPILLVKKKLDAEGKQKYRIAMDLRMLNSIIQGSSYPLPKIQTIIADLSAYKYFTCLDFQQAYHQIALPEDLQDKLTFTSMFGSFKYKRLCFGLKNAASQYQALMDTIIDEIDLEGIHAYQDDLIFGSNSFEETCTKLSRILEILIKYNLTLAPNKCTFHKTGVNYLGFHIQNHCISPIQSNIVKINSFPTPSTKRQLKKFIGVVTFYKSLVPNFSKLIQPLIDLTKPKSKFHWTTEHQQIFHKIQKIFFESPVVRLPDWDRDFYLNTDASNISIAGVLMQKHDNKLLPIAFFSKSLKPSEKRYPALKLELMAIYKSIIAFKYYLYNRKFTILSDSAPLKRYKKTTNPTDLTTKWLMEISEYSFDFEHIPGSSNILADYFSRCDFTHNQQDLNSNPELIFEKQPLPVVRDNSNVVNHFNDNNCNKIKQQYTNCLISGDSNNKDPLLEISNNTFVNEQIKDPVLSKIYTEILKKGFSRKYPNYFIHPDTKVLMYKKQCPNSSTFSYLIIVPNSLKAKTLTISHLSHFGLNKTYNFLSNKYFWKGIYTDTLNFVASCTRCLQAKHHNTLPAPLQPTYTPTHPGHTISVDLVGPFNNGHSVLTVLDIFSRHMELYPLKDTSAEKIVKCLFSYITTFGRPSVILSDLGPQFTSSVYNSFNSTLGIKITHSSVAHPQSNALSERINKSIKYSVNILMSEGHTFENSLFIHKSLYNGSKHSSTLYSPNLLHFGREISLIFDTFEQQMNQPFLDKNVDTHKLLEDLNKIYLKAYSNIKDNQNKRYQHFHRHAKLRPVAVHDIVYLKSVDKFKPKYTGPFIVLQKHSPVSFTIKRLQAPDRLSFRVHIDRLIIAPPRYSHLLDEASHNRNVNYNSRQSHNYNLRNRN